MRLVSKYVLASALAGLLACPALAQRNSPASASQITPSRLDAPLYRTPEVARALDLSRDQVGRLNEMSSTLRARYRDELDRLGRLDERTQNARRGEVMRNYAKDWDRGAGKIFSERQMDRYRQLELQSRGVGAFTDPDVQQKLDLTIEQRRRLDDLNSRYNQNLENIHATGRLRKDDTLGSWRDFMGQTRTQVNDILTERQRRTWRGLTGDPLDIPPPGLNGPSPPPGGTRR